MKAPLLIIQIEALATEMKIGKAPKFIKLIVKIVNVFLSTKICQVLTSNSTGGGVYAPVLSLGAFLRF